MEKELKIIFNNENKSYKQGTEYILNGNLIILSGINGSGKSQLLESIKNNSTNTYLDNKKLNQNEISFYSFKENINLSDFGSYDIESVQQYNNAIINIYTNYISLYNNYESSKNNNQNNFEQNLGIEEGVNCHKYCLDNTYYSIQFRNKQNYGSHFQKNISKQTISLIIEKIKEKNPNNFLKLNEFEVLSSIPKDLIIKFDDEILDGITRIFTEACRLKNNKIVEEAENNNGYTNYNHNEWLKTAPWTEINNLFAKLNFCYRFLDDFEYDGLYLKTYPQLYFFDNNTIDKNKSIAINNLSDGEKSILRLVIVTYDKRDDNYTKLLLLDEYDATLNPSLIEDYYTVINEYYIKNGVTVLLTTHSPATIALAPKNTKFYEIFKQSEKSPVIKEVLSSEYNELRVVNNYYNKIKNPNKRLKEIEKELDFFKKKFFEATKPIIITEGKTDWKHIKNAKRELGYNNFVYSFAEYDNDIDGRTWSIKITQRTS